MTRSITSAPARHSEARHSHRRTCRAEYSLTKARVARSRSADASCKLTALAAHRAEEKFPVHASLLGVFDARGRVLERAAEFELPEAAFLEAGRGHVSLKRKGREGGTSPQLTSRALRTLFPVSCDCSSAKVSRVRTYGLTKTAVVQEHGPGCDRLRAGPSALPARTNNWLVAYNRLDAPPSFAGLLPAHVCQWDSMVSHTRLQVLK